MPSEMSPRGSSPSSFFPEERQVGAWKMDPTPGNYGSKPFGALRKASVASSANENKLPMDSQIARGFDLPEYYLSYSQNLNLSPGKHFVQAEGAASSSVPIAVDHDLGSRINFNTESGSYCDSDKINLMGAQRENTLFSSSLSDLFNKLKLPADNALYGHAVGFAAASHYEEEEAFESLEELEALTIGNLLPDDDDLLSGVTDGLGGYSRTSNGEDMEDLDLFSNVGGMELGEDGSSWEKSLLSGFNNSNNELGVSGISNAVHPREHPSRTLFVRNINSNVEDSELRTLFEQYGDIRTLYTVCKHRGFVMISYYDIRAACNAMKALQNKPLMRWELDIHFSFPKDNPSEKDINQATVIVFNLDFSVSNEKLREIFGVYGEIKEIRDAPHRSHHKLVEFYDVRAADSAHRALNRSKISGQVSLGGTSPSISNGIIQRPRSTSGGSISSFLDHNGVSSGVPDSLSSLPNQFSITESSHLRKQLNFDLQGTYNFHPHSLPEYHDGLSNGPSVGSPSTKTANFSAQPSEIIDNQHFRGVSSNRQSVEFNEVFGSSGNGSCPPPGHQYLWSNNLHHPQSQPIMWPNSPTFVNGIGAARPQQLYPIPRAPSHFQNALHPLNNHHVGSAPSVNPSIWDRRHYTGESPDAAVFHPGSLGNMRISGNSPHPLEFVPHNIFSRTGGNCMDASIPSECIGLHPNHQRWMIGPPRGQIVPMMSSYGSPNERTRNRRHEGSSSYSDNKKQFELDLERILRGDDKRATLMIKNIPNKYTSKMLLAAIDERHRGTYDFIYLPIDFKNKCNVGYAFINMTDPSLIVPFYQTINGKKWEKFNSEKVATLAYARIQGKAALIAHFQNSSLMNEDKRCRPILFHTDGPNAGDQLPFPMGTNIRPRTGKIRGSTSEENNQELPSYSQNGEDYIFGDFSSGSGKDSD